MYPTRDIDSATLASCHHAVPLLIDLQAFIQEHRAHGPLTAHATEPAWNGYLLTVACSCGVVFERWVTSVDAESDLISWASTN